MMPACDHRRIDEDRRARGERRAPGRDRLRRPGEVVEDRDVARGMGEPHRQRPQRARKPGKIGLRPDQREASAAKSPPGRGGRCRAATVSHPRQGGAPRTAARVRGSARRKSWATARHRARALARRGDAQGPGFLALDLAASSASDRDRRRTAPAVRRRGRARRRSGRRRAPAPYPWLVGAGLDRPQGRLDLGDHEPRRPEGASPVSNGQTRLPAQRGSSRSARTTGMPVKRLAADRAGAEQLPARLRAGPSRRRSGAVRPARRRRGADGACACRWRGRGARGQPQNGNPPPETRRLSAAATSKRLLWLFSSSSSKRGDLVPHRPPRRSRQGRAGRQTRPDSRTGNRSRATTRSSVSRRRREQSAISACAAWRVGGLATVSPSAACRQTQMLSRPSRGTFAALQSTMMKVSKHRRECVRLLHSPRLRGEGRGRGADPIAVRARLMMMVR